MPKSTPLLPDSKFSQNPPCQRCGLPTILARMTPQAEAGRYAVYFHCQTDLVETFRELYPDLRYGGNRSIVLDAADKLPDAALRHCVALALTYHLRKRKAARAA